MSNVTSKASHRLLAAFLSFVMVFSMIPFSIVATAATTEYPDAFTVSVKDTEGNPIENATVVFSNSDTTWDIRLTGTTDASGIAVLDSAAIEDAYYAAIEGGASTATPLQATVTTSGSGYEDSEPQNVQFAFDNADKFKQHIELTMEKKPNEIADVRFLARPLSIPAMNRNSFLLLKLRVILLSIT